MGKQLFYDTVREWIGGVAFAIYLWSARMTKEEFWAEQEKQALEELRVRSSQDKQLENLKRNISIHGIDNQ